MAGGSYKVKQARDTGSSRQGRSHVGTVTAWHYQQHVLRDSDAWRPSLKLFPAAPPAASRTGIRWPVTT